MSVLIHLCVVRLECVDDCAEVVGFEGCATDEATVDVGVSEEACSVFGVAATTIEN